MSTSLRTLALAGSLAVGLLGVGVPAATAAPAPAPEVTVPDPTITGPYGVTRALYDEGSTVVTDTATGVTYPAELSGDLHFPSTGDGPFPVIVFQHGRHSTCDFTVAEFLGYPCPDTPVTTNIPSYAGYDYLGRLLASHGYVVASLDANAVNTFDSTGSRGMPERSQLLLQTLDLLEGWNDGSVITEPGLALRGRLDMDRIGVMGHSRGGEGVATLIEDNRTRTDGTAFSIDAVFALAAVDFNDPATDGVNFAALAPLCDGDVSNLQGTQAYDRSTYDPTSDFARVQFTVRGANHNFFNTTWTNDDWGTSADSVCNIATAGSERLEPADQRRIGIATISTFLRRYVGGELAFDPLMTGAVPIPSSTCPAEARSLDSPVACDQIVGVSYSGPAANRTMVFAPTDGAVATPTGLTTFAECDSDGGTACPDLNRSGNGQYTVAWDGPAELRLDLGGADLTGRDALTFRTTVNDDPRNQTAPGTRNTADFEVTIVSGATRFTVPASRYGTYALTDKRGDRFRQETMNGVRIPLPVGGVDLSSVDAVLFSFGRPGLSATGSIQLAEVGFQTDGSPVPPPAVPELPGPAGVVLAAAALVFVAWAGGRRQRQASRTTVAAGVS